MVVDVLIKKAPQLLVRRQPLGTVTNQPRFPPPHFVRASRPGLRDSLRARHDYVAYLRVNDRADDQFVQLRFMDLGIARGNRFMALPPKRYVLQLLGPEN